LKVLEEKQNKIEKEWKELYYKIPNLLDGTAAV